MTELKQALTALGVSVSDHEARQMFAAIDLDSKNIEEKYFYSSFQLITFSLFLENGM